MWKPYISSYCKHSVLFGIKYRVTVTYGVYYFKYGVSGNVYGRIRYPYGHIYTIFMDIYGIHTSIYIRYI